MLLITTATGKIGSELARLVLAAQKPVRLAAHTPEKARTLFPEAAIVPFDYEDLGTVTSALSGIERVFLAAPSDHFPAQLIHWFIDQAKAVGVQHIVLLSALGVEGNQADLATEQYLKQAGLSYTILRPGTFMQNYATLMVDSIRRQQVLFEPAGDALTSFVDTRDIAASACAVLLDPVRHTGCTYTLTGIRAYTRAEVAHAIGTATGQAIRYIDVPEDTFRLILSEQHVPSLLIERLISFYRMTRAQELATVTNDVEMLTGRPPVSFEQFTRDYRQVWL